MSESIYGTPAEIAAEYNVPEGFIRNAARTGNVRSIAPGDQLLVCRASYRKYHYDHLDDVIAARHHVTDDVGADEAESVEAVDESEPVESDAAESVEAEEPESADQSADQFVTIHDITRRARMGKSTFRNLRNRGIIPHPQHGEQYTEVEADQIVAIVEEHRATGSLKPSPRQKAAGVMESNCKQPSPAVDSTTVQNAALRALVRMSKRQPSASTVLFKLIERYEADATTHAASMLAIIAHEATE